MNGGLSLPELAIVPVHRTGSARATALFTTCLCQVAETWADELRARPRQSPCRPLEAARNAFEVFDWAHKNGGAAAEALECPEVPESAHRHIHEVRLGAKDPSGRPIWEA